MLKYYAPSRYRDTSEWKPFHHDAAAMKVLGKGRFSPNLLSLNKNIMIHRVSLFKQLMAQFKFQPDKARTQNFTVAVSFGCERY